MSIKACGEAVAAVVASTQLDPGGNPRHAQIMSENSAAADPAAATLTSEEVDGDLDSEGSLLLSLPTNE